MTIKCCPASHIEMYSGEDLTSVRFGLVRGAQLVGDICEAHCNIHETWLDLGCGIGYLTGRLAALNLQVMGVDYDREMIAAAQKHLKEKMEEAPASVLVGNVLALPFADASVDGVVAASLVGCLPSAKDFFRELHRVLRPGGLAIVTFTNRANIQKCWNRLRGRRLARPFQFYEIGEISQEFATAGFTIEKILFYNYFVELGGRIIPGGKTAKRLENRLRGKVTQRLAHNFIVVVRRI